MSREAGAYVSGSLWSLSPVVAITSSHGGRVNGQIAVTVINASIVYNRPRLIAGIWKRNYTHSFIKESRRFVLHLLRRDQISAVRNFGFYTGREVDKFRGVEWREGATGCPILLDSHSYAECIVINAMDGGDMTAFLAEVIRGGITGGGEWMTLSHFYTSAPPEWIAQYEARLRESVEYSISIIDNIDYSPWKP
ncbi:MAG: flavin reductase family protein [Candidatus Caldarchaeum sp.]